MAKRMPTVKELEAARKAADKVMLTSILANASKTAPKAAEGKTSAPSSAGLTVKPAATTTPVPPTVLPKVNSLGLLNPEIVNKYLQQGMAYAKQGPQSRMDIANSLLDFDIGDYKKGDVAGFNYDTMQEMNIRNRYFIGQHQRAGTFDFPEFLTDEYIAFPSTDYLTKQNDAVMVALEESKAKDAAAAASKEQNADQEVAWQNLYKAKQEEKDFFDEWYNLLLADHLLNNSGQIWDFEAADARYGEDVMDDVTYEAELKRLREQMQGVDWATKTGYNTANYESQTPALQAKYDLISGQLQNRNKAAELEAFVRSQPDFDEKRLYVDNYTTPEKGSLESIFSNDAFVQGLDDPLRYMHSDVNWASRELAGEYSGKAKYYFEHGYHLMAPEQLDTYTYLYQSKRYKEAADYIAAIQPELNKAMSDIVTEFYTTRDETIPGAIIDSLWSVPGKIKGTLDTGAGILMGKDDPNDPLYRTAQNVDTIRGVSGQTAGELLPFEVFGQKAGTFLYGLGMSTLDMIAAQKLAGIFGVATGKVDTMKNIMGAIMATEAGTDTFRSDLERGMGFEYSLGHGIANGLVNRWAESGFLDNLFSENGKFLTKVLKSGASGGLEEVFESGMNLGTDAFVSYLTGKQNKVEQTYNYYVATVGKDKAAAATMQHYANQFAADGLAGFIMGGTTSTVYNTGEYLDTRAAGKAVTKDGDIDTIMGIAKGMADDSESKRIADEITGKQEKGKKPSFYQFGQLTKAIIKDLGEERAAIVNRVQDEAIVERLVELGEDRTAAKQNASIIRRIARGEKVPRQEMFEAKWSDNASQVVKELTRETKDVESFAPGAVEDVGAQEIGGKWVEGNTQEAEANRTGNKWVTDMQNQQRAETENVRGKQLQVQVATVTPIGKAANRAEEAAKKRVPKRDGKPKMATDSHVTFRGADGSAEIFGDIMRFEESDEGMQVVVQTGKGKEGEQKVKLEDWISADGDGVATILSYIGDEQLPHSVTAEEANTLMQVYKHSGGNAKAVIQAFEVNFLAGYSGNNQVGSVLDPGLANVAYEAGKAEAAKDEEHRIEKAKNFRANANPTVTWEGLTGEEGTRVLNEKYESMAEGQRLAVDFGKALSKHTGLNVVYYDGGHDNDSAGYAENGSYDPTTHTIKINVSAGASTVASYKQGLNMGTLGYVAMKVFGHEITHAIESTSTEAYAQYKQAVKDALKAKGQDWATLVRDKIDMYSAIGKKLTYAGAEAEVIADASESMLRNSQFVNNLDAGLKGKLQAAIKEFVEKLKQVFKALAGGHREAVALMDELGNYSKELQDLWDAGFAEMTGAGTKTVSPAEVATEPANDTHPAAKQFSITQLADSIGLDVMITGESDTPYAIVDSNGNIVTSVSPEQIEGTQMGKLIEAAVLADTIDEETADAQKKMIADLATLAARYEDQAMVWEIAGSQLYSAIKNNSDKQYSKTVDFGTICSKTQAVVDVLSDTMLKLGRGLTRKEVITAYNKTANNGLSVPCAPCYVFSRWMGVPSLLGRMAEFQARFGKMTAAELTEYVDGVQRKYAVDGERFSKTIGSMKTRLDNQLETVRGKIQHGRTLGEDVTDLLTLADKLENEFADVEAYNWVTQVLLKSNRVSGAIEVARDADGQVVIDPAYKPVPSEVLFDMRKTGEFANYPKSWKYRSTRGAGMGKSILPYSGATVGDTVYADQKRRAISKNAFRSLNATKTQRVRAIKTAQKRMKSQNLIGGHRFQSTSDYRPEWGLDYIMTFLEMQAIEAKGQLYTKVIEAVDMFATAGIEVNLSIMANGDGWHLDENGNPVLGVEDFSSVSGIDFTDALQKTKDYDNVQMILVGMNDTHIKLAMADDRITFIIPWHSSGSSESVLKQLFSAVGEDLHTGSDYQDIQSDKPVNNPTPQQKLNAEVRKKILTGQYAKKGKEPTSTEMATIRGNKYLNALYERFYVKGVDDETYGVRLSAQQASQVFPYEYWDTSLTYKDADENGKRFVEYCNDIGLTPRFEKFKGDPGYWKLLIDRRMYNRDGTYHHPKTINVTNVKIGDIASSVSQAKYGDPTKTGNAVQETIEEILANESAPAYVEPSVIDETANYGDQAEVETTVQYSIDGLDETVTTRDYLAESGLEMAETVEERNALTIYQERLKAHAEASKAVVAAEEALIGKEGQELADARAELAKARKRQKDLYNRLLKVENTEHVKKVVERTQRFINEELHGKTKKQLEKIVADREQKILELRAELNGLKEAAKNQRTFDRNETEEIYKERIDKINERNDKKAYEDHVKKVSEQVERHNYYEARLHDADVKNRQKIKDQKIRDMVHLENTIAKYEREIARLNNKATAMFLENHMKYLDRIADIRERRDLNLEIRKKERHLKGTVKALSDLVLHETDYKNVKEPIKPAVHALVKAFVDDFGNLVFYNPSDEAVSGGKQSALEAREKFERLKMAYDKLANIDGEEAMAYDPEVSAWLAELHTLAESYDNLANISESKTRLKTKLYIYERLSGIADSIAFMVKTADQIFVNGRRQQIANVAGDVADTLSEKADKKEFTGKLGEAVNALDDSLLKGNMTAVTFFESLGNSGLKHLYDDITEAERVSAARVKDARDFITDLMKKHGYLSWNNMRKPVSFVTEQGREVYMTTGNMLWAYAVAKRELSNPLAATHHLSEGGFAYDEKTKRTKEVNNSQWKNDHNKLSAKDIVTIEHMLTDDQKAFADACIEYLSTECADWGNEASLALFGIKKYNEEYYFPFQVDGDQLYKNSAAGSASTTDDARLKHLSFTHRVTANANKPLIMGDFLDIVDNHINQMAIYSAFVLPIENLNRVLNSKVEYNDEDVTIRSLIARKHGKAAQKYLNDFLKDMNGGPQTDKRGEMNAFIRLFKKNAVMGKLQVALQQFSSIARAFVYINPKYFLNIPKELPYTTWERMMQYSGTTVYKDMGGFNIGLGKQAADWIGKGALEEYNYWERGKFLLDQKGVAAMKDNWVDFLTALPGVVDKMTWAMIWTATENEQADLHPGMDRNSVEFLEMVGERFDDIVRHSQVYDSVLAKSQNMRSKSGLAKMITSFMAEPTLTMNMLYSAVRSKDKKVIARTVSSLVLNSVLGALGYAAIAAWDKDDDERTATEKFVTKFSGKLADSINPLTMIPFVSDFWSLINGYDVERTDMAVFADLYKYGANFIGKLSEGKEITFRDYENFLGTAVLTATGVPLKNLMGDFRKLVLNLPGTDFSAPPASRVKYGVLDEVVFGRDTSNTAYYERLMAATMDGDKQEMYDLKDYLMATKGVKETSITSGVRDAYKKVYMRGDITKNEAVSFLLANGLVSGKTETERKQNAFEYVDKWEEGTEGYSAYNTLRKAFSDGNSASIQKAWDELEANGWSNDSIGSYVRNTIIKGMVTSGQITTSKATELIRKWYPYKKDKDNVDKPKEWLNSK